MSSSGFDMSASGLHQTGRTISGRSESGGSAASLLKQGLDSGSGTVGHHSIKSAMSRFVTNRILDSSIKLPVQLDSGGVNVSNVAGVARDDDNERATRLSGPIGGSTGISGYINWQV